jgi:NADPH-dependent curcumin reductase CurA
MGTWFDQAPAEFSEWIKGKVIPTESQEGLETFNKIKVAWYSGHNQGKESINEEST